jgi:C_GCAxxG_C_C family probable redox protein
MALGIRYGRNGSSVKKRLRAYDLANRFYKQFEQQHGSILCRELIGCDLSNGEGLDKARKEKVFEEKCVHFVRKAVEILVGIDGI